MKKSELLLATAALMGVEVYMSTGCVTLNCPTGFTFCGEEGDAQGVCTMVFRFKHRGKKLTYQRALGYLRRGIQSANAAAVVEAMRGDGQLFIHTRERNNP
jgi:hypothetical protein